MGREELTTDVSASRAVWWRLAAAAVVLLLEVMLLTPFVEFTRGAMVWVTNPVALTGGMIGLAAFFVITSSTAPDLRSIQTRRSRTRAVLWSLAHAGLYLAFFRYTLFLNAGDSGNASSWLQPAAWCAMGVAVALTLALVFFPRRQLAFILRRCAPQLAAAAMLGTAMALLTPAARSAWPYVDDTSMDTIEALLETFPGDAFVENSQGNLPIIGTQTANRGLRLLVTPQCSETESVLAFVLLAGTLLVVRWDRLRIAPFALSIVLGAGLLYLLNALRLYLLLLVGLATNAWVCVSLAHSRLSGILFLAISMAYLALAVRWCRPLDVAAPPATDPSVPEAELEAQSAVEDDREIKVMATAGASGAAGEG